jgi:hypothetical protein
MLVTTTKGEMDTALLTKKEGTVDNEVEETHWVEYWLDGELVHRSVNMRLKKMPVFANAIAAAIG